MRIYILDEVHMLSTSAWNALLKLLEEPPAHVRFIFATTEVDKVLATVLSRCQRFDFRAIDLDNIVKRLREICAKEEVRLGDAVLYRIARAAGGGMRDAQTLLDQLIAVSEGEAIEDDLNLLLGAARGGDLELVVDHLLAGNASPAIEAIDRIVAAGVAPATFLDQLVDHARTVLLVQACGAESPAVRRLGELHPRARRPGQAGHAREDHAHVPDPDLLPAGAAPGRRSPPAARARLRAHRRPRPAGRRRHPAATHRAPRAGARGRACPEPSLGPGPALPRSPARTDQPSEHHPAQPRTPAAGALSAAVPSADAGVPAPGTALAATPAAPQAKAAAASAPALPTPSPSPTPNPIATSPQTLLPALQARWAELARAALREGQVTLAAALTDSTPVALAGDLLTIELPASFCSQLDHPP